MNKVILMGRLTREPDVRQAAGNPDIIVAHYTLAVNRNFKRNNEDNTDFIPCVAFRKNAEFAEKFLHQGTKILLAGRIQTGSYTNKEGQKVYTTEIVVTEQEFAESRTLSSRDSEPVPLGEEFMNIPDGLEEEDLPFN